MDVGMVVSFGGGEKGKGGGKGESRCWCGVVVVVLLWVVLREGMRCGLLVWGDEVEGEV